MSKTYELVQRIELSNYQCEAGYLKNDITFRTLVQRCLALEDALLRERLNKEPLLKRNES